jgi:predicted Holliday junction resolvase-like endonuclease
MIEKYWSIILWILIWCFIWYLMARIFFRNRIRHQRKDAVNRSRSVVMGQVNEQIAPLLPNFPYHYKDAMFLGKGVDYLIFDGMHSGFIKEIIFLEIKSWTSFLNKNERMIQQCIEDKKIKYSIFKC